MTENQNSQYVLFGAEIDVNTIRALVNKLAEVHAASPDSQIVLMMNSDGGMVAAGVSAYHILRGLGFPLTTVNIGRVDSIANVLFLAGDRRICHQGATFMWHSIGFNQTEPVRLDMSFLRQKIGGIVADHRKIGAVVEERTSLAMEDIVNLLGAEVVKDARWALEVGMVHEIVEPPYVIETDGKPPEIHRII